LASIIFSMIATTLAVPRTVMVFAVLFAASTGCTAIAGMRITWFSVCTSSVASACEMKNVRMTCSSYAARFCALSGITMIVRWFTTL
jgi:hypothetical protein